MDAMNKASNAIQKLMVAHFQRNEAAFKKAAKDVIKYERRLKHNVLADELEKILLDGTSESSAKNFFSTLSSHNGNIPKDRDHDGSLVELSNAEHNLEHLVLDSKLRSSLMRLIEEHRSSDLLRSYGCSPMRKVLFCGPPGCGKTMAASALANEMYLPLATVRFDAVVSSYLGETASNLRKVFDFARTRPVVLFFDEFDAIGKQRTALDEHGELKRVVNSFLQLLDSFHSETITLAATNHQGLLDPALWRRFDDIMFFALPDVEQIESLLCNSFKHVELSPSVKLKTTAKSLVGFSHADVVRIANETIKEFVLAEYDRITPVVLKRAVERQKDRRKITMNQPEAETVATEPKAKNGNRKRRS